MRITDVKHGAKAHVETPRAVDKRRVSDRRRHEFTLQLIAWYQYNPAPSEQLQRQESISLARAVSIYGEITTLQPSGTANASGLVEKRAEAEHVAEMEQHNIQDLEKDDGGEMQEKDQTEEDRREQEGDRGEGDNENDEQDVVVIKIEDSVDDDEDVVAVKEEKKTIVQNQVMPNTPHRQSIAERAVYIGLASIGSIYYDPTDTDPVTALQDALVVARADLAARRRAGMIRP